MDIPLEKRGTCPEVRRLPEESTPNSYVQPKGGTPSESHIPLEKKEMHLVVHSLLEKSTSNSYVQPKGGTQSNLIVPFKRTTSTNFCFSLKGTKSSCDVVFERKIRHGSYVQPKGGTVPFSIADSRFDLIQLIFALSLFYALAFFVTIRCTNSGANFAAALHTSIFTCSATFRSAFFSQSQLLCSALPAAKFPGPNWAY